MARKNKLLWFVRLPFSFCWSSVDRWDDDGIANIFFTYGGILLLFLVHRFASFFYFTSSSLVPEFRGVPLHVIGAPALAPDLVLKANEKKIKSASNRLNEISNRAK